MWEYKYTIYDISFLRRPLFAIKHQKLSTNTKYQEQMWKVNMTIKYVIYTILPCMGFKAEIKNSVTQV